MLENNQPKFDPQLYKSCENKTANIFCTQEGCNIPALACGDFKCACMLEKHKNCHFTKIQSLFNCLLKQRVQISEKTKQTLKLGMKIFDQLLQEVTAKRRDYYCFVKMFGYEKNSRAVMICVEQGKYDSITGDLINKAEKETAEKFKKNQKLYNSVNIYTRLEEKVGSLIPQMQKMTKYYRSDQSKIADFAQIQKFFQKQVSHFQLLYRGSEHYFSADAYHKKCDQIEDSLLILETEFGKKIGGFTPLKRNKSGQTVTDQSGKSFMFSLTLNEKYQLKNKTYAFGQYANQGPDFGCNNDLQIMDSCHTNASNKCDFPTYYNNGKYSKNQTTYTAISGQPSGNTFKVKQYEVFKVHWK